MKQIILKSIFCLLLFISIDTDVNAQEYQSWKIMHPRPLANSLKAHKMFDAKKWVVVGAEGTFMKTTNAGLTWLTHHKAGMTAADSATSSCTNLHFFNEMNGIVIGDKGYIGKTADGGETFTTVGTGVVPSNQRCNRIWFANANVGYISSQSGSGFAGTIAKTTDGGATWANIYTTSEQAVTTMSGTSVDTVYAALADGTMLKTVDGGTTWTSFYQVFAPYMYSMKFVSSSIGFVAGSQNKIYRTTNAGATWDTTASPGGDPDNAYFEIEAVSPAEIYLVGDIYNLYKSTNQGNSWTSIPINVNGPALWFTWYSMEIVGTNWTLVGDFGIVAHSTDSGGTWNSTNTLQNSNIIFDIQAIKGTNKVIAAGRQLTVGTKHVFYSTDGGNNWTTKDIGVNFDAYAINMVNENVGYICGTNSTVVKTTDGGLTWNQKTSPVGTAVSLYTMQFVNPDTGWVFVNYIFSGINAYKTTDGGDTWQPQQAGTAGIMAACMVDANVGYVTMNPSNKPIYKTTNGGTTWDAVTTPLLGNIYAVKALDANNVYIGQSFGANRVAKSTDGGATWTSIALPVAIDIHSIDFKDVNNGYVAGNMVSTVARTTDGGVTWTWDNLHIPTLVKVKYGNADTVFALGTFGSVYRNVSDHAAAGLSVNVSTGWNIVSEPLQSGNMSVPSLFPGANSPAYIFAGGYITADTMRVGAGYWLRFPAPAQINLSGSPVRPFTTNLNQGWNIIGAMENMVPVANISTNPPGIINSLVFGYDNGYQSVTSLTPGKGYWVRTTQTGTLTITETIGSSKQITSTDVSKFGEITVRDSKGNESKLYIADAAVDAASFALPPVPPANGFDCRFTSDKSVERISTGMVKTMKVSSENYPVTISARGISISLRDKVNGQIVNQTLLDGSSVILNNSACSLLEVSRDIKTVATFNLAQNYPNPFNPSTSIQYQMPKDNFVTLKVYDILGVELVTLVNANQKAGAYTVSFDGSSFPSGVYLYSLKAGEFSATKKFMLMK